MQVKIFWAPIVMEGRGTLIDNKNPRFNGTFTELEFTDRIEDCDFVVLPKSIATVARARSAIEEGKRLAKQYGKELVVFFYGDHSYREHIEGVIAFKWSAHAADMLPTEVITPVFFHDLAKEREITWRHKGDKPRVSFCGYADFSSVKTAAKYHFDNGLLNLRALVTGQPHLRAQKRGLYFRRKSMRILKRDPRIDCQFIVRSAFFNQVQAPPQALREEYLTNMQEADFVLAPRGDANISTRFFEALSLGRIPILIDTDVVLPLEKIIDYGKFILRVPHTEMHTLPERVVDFYDAISDDEFVAMQQRARETYLRYLEVGPFINFVLPLLKAKGPQVL